MNEKAPKRAASVGAKQKQRTPPQATETEAKLPSDAVKPRPGLQTLPHSSAGGAAKTARASQSSAADVTISDTGTTLPAKRKIRKRLPPVKPTAASSPIPAPMSAPAEAAPRVTAPNHSMVPAKTDIVGGHPAIAAAEAVPGAAATPKVDIERFSQNFARLFEEAGKALAAFLKPREDGQIAGEPPDEIADVVKTLGQVTEYWLGDPQRALEVQTSLGKAYLELWASAAKRLAGEASRPVAEPGPRDRRFADPEWSANPFFDFLKQAYLLSADWAERLVKDAKGLDPRTKQKAEFYVRQIANAVSPSNFVFTNPELLRETLASNAENLVRGMRMLAEDIEAGHGHLKIRQSDSSMFEVGRNLAITPGKVIYQNELMQLLQYTPTTKMVLKRPLLIVPPWINKYYILDLTPEKSFVKWCVDQGLTVFMISWVNPDANLAKKSFEDYMREGPLEALDVIETATGEHEVNAIGYCVGGTLLAATLAYMAAKQDKRIVSATLFAAQVDFTYAGDLQVFVDEKQIDALERRMGQTGFLEAEKMAMAFNLLRSNDLIWPYVINNYLKGQAPFPFDLLYWNSDATRLPAANHSFYLRNCYLENRLSRGEMMIADEKIDLGKVTIPVYNLATREDHIAPAQSAFVGSKCFGGPVKFVLAGSGHIAGVINPPYKTKYSFWTGGPAQGDFETWRINAQERPGSWWPDWVRWVKDQDATEVPAREPGGGKFPALEEAPGSYVKITE